MYQNSKVLACLAGLVGFRQNDVPGLPRLDADIVASESGEHFNAFHPLINYQNLVAAAPNFAEYSYPGYQTDVAYSLGQRVFFDGKTWESVKATPHSDQPGATEAWRALDLFSDWLRIIRTEATTRLVAELFERKKLQEAGKTILEDLYLFDGGGNLNDLEIKTGRFVGWEINFVNSRDLVTILQEVGTQFTSVNPEFKLYLYHSSQAQPLQIFNLELARQGGVEWNPLKINNVTAVLDGDNKGVYYLGYYESDLQGQAVRRRDSLLTPPCVTCNAYNTRAYKSWSKYLKIQTFAVASSHVNGGRDLWNQDKNEYLNNTNFGLNLKVSVECDLTGFICRHRKVLTKALGLQVAVNLLERIAFSQRQNGLTQEVKAQAVYELNNKENSQAGLRTQLDRALKALVLDTQDFNSACLSCGPTPGIEWGNF